MNQICYAGKHNSKLVSLHSHVDWEIIYCTSGDGEFDFGEEQPLCYTKGDIVVIPPELSHTNTSKTGFTNVYLNIKNATLPFKHAVKIADDEGFHILNAFEDAYFFFNSQIDKRDIILSAFGNLISSYILAFQQQKPLSKVVETIKNDIIANFSDSSYRLDEYMREFPFSYDYLRKLFKNEIGITPHSYLIEIRLSMAKKLLYSMCENDYNISKIAQMCGFDEPLYFSRVFKNQFGCSPSNYAKLSVSFSSKNQTETE